MPAKIREDEILKILNDPSKQLNPKTISSTMVTPEWSIKPRQIYEAQKIKTIEMTRIWLKEAIRISKQKDTRMGVQNKEYYQYMT